MAREALKPRIKIVRVKVRKHKDTDLRVAYSDDLKGLLVPGRSVEELEEKLPAAITEILEAHGHTVLSVDLDDSDELPEAFVPREIIAAARMRAV